MSLFKKLDTLNLYIGAIVCILLWCLFSLLNIEWVLVPGAFLGIIFGKFACIVYPKYCFGMGFDGGPLEWVEVMGAVIGSAIFYTFLIILIKKIWCRLRKG